jgi:ribonuclease P protein subunit POP4
MSQSADLIGGTMITPQNIFRHELVGLDVEIVQSVHNGFTGIKGEVVDETKNTIKVEDVAGLLKIIPKNVATFRFTLPSSAVVEVDGRIIVARPEDRIKKKFRKY